MNYNPSFSILANNDSYHTEENNSNFSYLNFYFFISKIIVKSSNLAKRGLYDDNKWEKSSFDIFKVIENNKISFSIEGMNYFRNLSGPAIFISNHMSTLETLVLPSIINPKKRVVFIVKKELISYPVFGNVIGARDPIIVGRENPREDLKIVLEAGKNRLEDGKSIIIFPQKTRSMYFDTKNFNTLGIKLAKNNNVPVIPLALWTSAWGNGKIIKELGKIDIKEKVYFEFGEPITIKGNGSEEHSEILDFIKSRLIKWGKGNYIKS